MSPNSVRNSSLNERAFTLAIKNGDSHISTKNSSGSDSADFTTVLNFFAFLISDSNDSNSAIVVKSSPLKDF